MRLLPTGVRHRISQSIAGFMDRDTHARIYQREISRDHYEMLRALASQKHTSVRKLLRDAIKQYLNDSESRSLLDVEEMETSCANVRFYLWLPYENVAELDQLMKKRGTCLQQLVLKAIKQHEENAYKLFQNPFP